MFCFSHGRVSAKGKGSWRRKVDLVRQGFTNRTTLPWRWDARSWDRGLSLELKAHTYLCNWKGKVGANRVMDDVVGIGNLGNFPLKALIFLWQKWSSWGVAMLGWGLEESDEDGKGLGEKQVRGLSRRKGFMCC